MISIITPTFNSASTLKDTLDSVAMQDYPRVEHLIIDGLSTDGTLEMARASAHGCRVWSARDSGLYDAMNKGLAMAEGDILGILNSDDFYVHGQVLSRVADLMERTGADCCYADLEYVDVLDTGKVLRLWRSGRYRPGNFIQGWMPPHPTFFFRRHLYEKYGGFNLSLRFSADYELMLRLLHRHRASVCYLPEVIVRMRAGGVSNASWRNRLKANREDRLAWQLNGMRPRFYTTILKPLRKLGQFI